MQTEIITILNNTSIIIGSGVSAHGLAGVGAVFLITAVALRRITDDDPGAVCFLPVAPPDDFAFHLA